jgi:predicted nucleic acid-binding protein
MNGHIFDTCTISKWFEGKPLIVSAMNSLPGDDLLYVSSVSIGEIEFGHLSKNANDPVKQAEFRLWIEKTFKDPVLPITKFTARSYSHLRRIICDNYIRRGKQIELYEDAHASKRLSGNISL